MKAKCKHLFLWDSSQKFTWISISQWKEDIDSEYSPIRCPAPQRAAASGSEPTHATHLSRLTSCPLSSTTIKIAIRIFLSRLGILYTASREVKQKYSKIKILVDSFRYVNSNDFFSLQMHFWSPQKKMVLVNMNKLPLLGKIYFSVPQKRGAVWAAFMVAKLITLLWHCSQIRIHSAKVDLSSLAWGKAGPWKWCSGFRC